MEKIVEEPPTSAVLLDHCHFSQVIFNSMEKFYVPGGDITCYYTFTQHFIPRRKDWIGIFRVGWKTTREYYTFMWVALPSDLKMDLAKQQEVQFKAYYLPKDDEYYQFCYVDQDGVVRGASIPFQFRLETEDDILVVTTKGKVEEIEQHNKELCEENQELKDSCVSLQKQKSDMQAELKRKQGKVEEIEQHNKELCEENQELKDSCVSLQKQNSDMQAELKRKQGKVEEIEQHNKELCEENQELKDSCVSLQKQNSDMQAEFKRKQGKVEEIEQHNKELCEENQELKDSCVSLQKQNSDMQAELKRKQGKVEKIEQHNKELCEENQELKDSCVSLQKQNSDMQAELKRKQGELGTLHSTNNKLEEKVKEQKAYWETELLQLKENNQKVSSENEKMAIRVDQLQAQLLTQEKEMEKLVQGDQNKSEQLQHLKSENDQLFISLTEQKEHQKELQQTVEEMKQKETITVKKQQKLMESRNKKTTVEDQLVQEVERLKAKVEAGKACYLEKYKECQRLHKQIRQLRAAALDENSKLCRQLSEYKTLLDNLQREIEILERENDLLEKENGRLVRCTCQNFGLSLTRVPTSIQRGTDQNPRLRYGNPYSGVQESSASSLLSKK